MQKWKKFLPLIAAAALLIGIVAVYLARNCRIPYEDNPFAGITAEDFTEIGLLEGETVVARLSEEERNRLIPLLLQVELWGRPQSYRTEDYAGGAARMFRITLENGRCFDFSAFGGIAYLLDGVTGYSEGYDYELGEAISSLYTELFEQYTGRWPYG